MEKAFKLNNLGCAACAAKMERAIGKIDGVTDVSITFMTQRLRLSADVERFDEIVAKAQEAICKIEPDCTIEKA